MLPKALLLIPLAFTIAQAAELEVTGPRTDNVTKIIGGTPAFPNEFPFFTRLLVQDGQNLYLCGGSIISTNWAVTAAHCVSSRNLQSVTLQVGLNSVSNPSPGYYSRQADRVIIHPGWNEQQVVNDIALVRVIGGFQLNTPGSQQVALPGSNFQCIGDSTVLGYGLTTETGTISDRLIRAQIPIRTDTQCLSDLGSGFQPCCMTCAGLEAGGVGPCLGDAGGPLVLNSGQWRVLCGISSWSYGCARPRSPAVFTRVQAYVNWIISIVGNTVEVA